MVSVTLFNVLAWNRTEVFVLYGLPIDQISGMNKPSRKRGKGDRTLCVYERASVLLRVSWCLCACACACECACVRLLVYLGACEFLCAFLGTNVSVLVQLLMCVRLCLLCVRVHFCVWRVFYTPFCVILYPFLTLVCFVCFHRSD